MSGGKELAVNLLVAAGALAVVLGGLEIAARVFLPRSEPVLLDEAKTAGPAHPKERRVRPSMPNRALFRETETGGRMYPNVRVVIRKHLLSGRKVEIETNTLGYRGAEIPAKTEEDLRILVLGDSITLADYAPEEETYPARMEQRLRGYTAKKSIRVINAGVAGLDLRSELMVLMETGLSTRPDIVVEGLYLNDAAESFTLNETAGPPLLRFSRLLTFVAGRIELAHARLRFRSRERDRAAAKRQFLAGHPVSDDDWHDSESGFNREIADTFFDWGYAWSDDAWSRMGETLQTMQQVAQDHGFELVVVLLPVKQQVQSQLVRDEPQRYFGALASRLGLPHVDLLPALREAYARDGRDLYYDHCHYRPEGDALIGRIIADTLVRESPVLHRAGLIAAP